MGKCQDCKHWERAHAFRSAPFGECSKIIDTTAMVNEDQAAWIVSVDPLYRQSELYTMPYFSCVLWEAEGMVADG